MKPTRSGAKWTQQEDIELADVLAECVINVAKEHKRTEAAISSRMQILLDGPAIARAIKRIKNETYYE